MKPYRVLVTGPRDWTGLQTVFNRLDEARSRVPLGRPMVVVHGACRSGADAFVGIWATLRNVRAEAHPAQGHPTEDFGPWPGAGPRRNEFMVNQGADECLAFIQPCSSPKCRRSDPHGSHGTANCAGLAEAAGIPTRRYSL